MIVRKMHGFYHDEFISIRLALILAFEIMYSTCEDIQPSVSLFPRKESSFLFSQSFQVMFPYR